MFGRKVVNIYIKDNGIVVVDEEGVDVNVRDDRTKPERKCKSGDIVRTDGLNFSEDGTYKVMGVNALNRLTLAPKIDGVYSTRHTLSVDEDSVKPCDEGIEVTVNGGYRYLHKGETVIPKDQKLQNDSWYVAQGTTDRVLDIKTIDNRKSTIVFREELFIPSDYYPTAEQARQIEPEIRHDLVDRITKDTLNRVQEAAKEGRTCCRTYSENHDLTVGERFRIRKLFEELGYETTSLECPVEMVKW